MSRVGREGFARFKICSRILKMDGKKRENKSIFSSSIMLFYLIPLPSYIGRTVLLLIGM